MTGDFSDILMDGESIIWSGQPDWSRAKARNPLISRLKAMAVFLVATACFFALLIMGFAIPLDGFPGMLAIAGIFVFAIIALVAIAMGYGVVDQRVKGVEYLLTDRRLVQTNEKSKTRTSIMRGFASAVHRHRNGEVFDIYVGLASDIEAGPAYDASLFSIVLQAIPDGPLVEKLILETLMSDSSQPAAAAEPSRREH